MIGCSDGQQRYHTSLHRDHAQYCSFTGTGIVHHYQEGNINDS